MSLLQDLKRRNVFRVAVAYVVASWLLLQVGDVVLGLLDVPAWGLRLVLGVLVLGFPLALIFSWVYELTPDGLKRDAEVDHGSPASRQAARKLNLAVIVLLSLSLGVFGLGRFLWPDKAAPMAGAGNGADAAKSIAVLPFEAFSNDASDAYFGKGLAEELLNALARYPDLKVAARTSAFSFEGREVPLTEIARQLGVAHVLEGSVRKSGDKLRVTAKLIASADGSRLWSETYERTLTDVFAIQDDIVEEINRVLEIRLGVGGGGARASGEGVDPRAYEQYLKGLALWGNRDGPNSIRVNALAAFRLATQFDPGFADAWAAVGNVGAFSSPGIFDESVETYAGRTEKAFARALEIDPDNASAHAGLGRWHSSFVIDIPKARQHIARAVELAPNRAETHYAMGLLQQLTGDDGALTAFDRAVALDPLNLPMRRMRAVAQLESGNFNEALAFLDSCAQQQCLQGGYEFLGLMLAMLTRDQARIGQWMEILQPIFSQFDQVPEQQRPADFRVMRSWISIFLDDENAERDIAVIRELSAGDLDVSFIGIIGPELARILPEERFFAVLETSADNLRVFSEPFFTLPLHPDLNPYPDHILRHPRYREFWQRPGLAELAEIRRANGKTAGLPLPASDP